jgi:hypothetical protein
VTRGAAAVALAAIVACGAPAASGTPPQPVPGPPVGRPAPDTTALALIPPGLGTLKQDDIAIVLQPTGVRVTAIPLDETVIRTLAADSYRSLHATIESKRQQITQRAASHGVRAPRVWLATFVGLTPDARFSPTDITVTSGGRDYRPIDVIALTPGFSEQRLQPREIQRALLLFDEGLDVSQPVVVAMGTEKNTDWSNDRGDSILSKIETERSRIQARAASRP